MNRIQHETCAQPTQPKEIQDFFVRMQKKEPPTEEDIKHNDKRFFFAHSLSP